MEAYTETYKGQTINIMYDEGPENPFEAWDCEPPLAVYSGDRNDGITEYATKYGNVNNVPTLTRAQIKANLKAISGMLGQSIWSLGKEARENQWFAKDFVDYVNEAIRETVDGEYDSKRLEVLVDVYNWAGMPALYRQITGSSQGDWAYVLAVATPAFQEACGNKAGYWDDADKLAPSIKLFENWAFGNVYGYEALDEDGEQIDSCWGYYGDYDEKDGPLDEAKASIDGYLVRKIESERLEAIEDARLARIRRWKSYGGVALMLASFLAVAVAGVLIANAVINYGLSDTAKMFYSIGGGILSFASGCGVVIGMAIHNDYKEIL